MAASTAREWHNSDQQTSGEKPFFSSKERALQLIGNLDIPEHERRTFLVWWTISGEPTGPRPRTWKGMNDLAEARGRCERTVREHVKNLREKYGLVKVAIDASGKLLTANTWVRPVTYDFCTEVIAQNSWPECKRCRHKHQSDEECGCDTGSRMGRFRTKSGVVKKLVPHRICRCKPQHPGPIPFRPQRASHAHKSPAEPPRARQEPPNAPPVTVPAPVAVAVPPKCPHGFSEGSQCGICRAGEHRSPARGQPQEEPPPKQPKLTRRECQKVAATILYYMRGCDGRSPKMNFRKAIEYASADWKRDPDAIIEALKFWRYQFDDIEESP